LALLLLRGLPGNQRCLARRRKRDGGSPPAARQPFWSGPVTVQLDWRSRAACRETDPELFFPEGVQGPALQVANRAKQICALCPVRMPCLDWALAYGAAFGIWGGRTEQERRADRLSGASRPQGQGKTTLRRITGSSKEAVCRYVAGTWRRHARPLRLSDAGDAQSTWIGVLTTEHYNLAMLRIATISEATGRASVSLGAVSAGLIALGFQGIGHGRSAFEVLVLSSLTFLGFVAFLRCLEVSIDDWEFGMRIAQLRNVYCELMPDLVGVLAMTSATEESVTMLSGRWQPFQKMLSIAGSVGVLASVIFGSDLGVLAYGVGTSLYVAIGVGAAAGLVSAVLASVYQYKRWCGASPTARLPVQV
jgi:hypothetical protein